MAKKTKLKKAKRATKKAAVVKKKPAGKKAAAPSARAFVPPYKCQRTLEEGVCLKFIYNPTNRQYDLGGDEVACGSCKYFL